MTGRRWTWTLVLAAVGALAAPTQAWAAEPITIPLDAGQACQDFPVTISIQQTDTRVFRQFRDAQGNVVRTLESGRGNELTFTNETSRASVSLPATGAVSRTTVNSDGTQTVVSTGNNVVVLFPTDLPAGPTTTLYVGRLVYTVDAQNNFTVQSFAGRTVDLCAALS